MLILFTSQIKMRGMNLPWDELSFTHDQSHHRELPPVRPPVVTGATYATSTAEIQTLDSAIARSGLLTIRGNIGTRAKLLEDAITMTGSLSNEWKYKVNQIPSCRAVEFSMDFDTLIKPPKVKTRLLHISEGIQIKNHILCDEYLQRIDLLFVTWHFPPSKVIASLCRITTPFRTFGFLSCICFSNYTQCGLEIDFGLP